MRARRRPWVPAVVRRRRATTGDRRNRSPCLRAPGWRVRAGTYRIATPKPDANKHTSKALLAGPSDFPSFPEATYAKPSIACAHPKDPRRRRREAGGAGRRPVPPLREIHHEHPPPLHRRSRPADRRRGRLQSSSRRRTTGGASGERRHRLRQSGPAQPARSRRAAGAAQLQPGLRQPQGADGRSPPCLPPQGRPVRPIDGREADATGAGSASPTTSATGNGPVPAIVQTGEAQ